MDLLMFAACAAFGAAGGSGPPSQNTLRAPSDRPVAQRVGNVSVSGEASAKCGDAVLTVHFYDVGQALAVLVDLPDGRAVMVDTGESSKRSGCGPTCAVHHRRLMKNLESDLGGRAIDLLLVTHQHSDHIGGAQDILNRFVVKNYVDNGRNLDVLEVRSTRRAAALNRVPVGTVEPGHTSLPLREQTNVSVRAVVPSRWLPDCDLDRNHCSVMLRIDYCASSLLLTGDEELSEEPLFGQLAPVTLLQVGHHGSDTSTGGVFLKALKPKYAVVSVGKQGEGMNRGFCHPRAQTVRSLAEWLGGAHVQSVRAFDSQGGAVECRCSKKKSGCRQGTDLDWVDVPVSDKLWTTARDSDIVLQTRGDGTFERRTD